MKIIDEIKWQLDILTAIQQYIPGSELKRRGHKFWCCCPFHGEKTPSFMINPDRNNFHCFGCGEHGDQLDLVAKILNLSLSETVKLLASDLGLTYETDTEAVRERRRAWQEEQRQREAVSQYEQSVVNAFRKLRRLHALCEEQLKEIQPRNLNNAGVADTICLMGNTEILIDMLLSDNFEFQMWALTQSQEV